MKDMRQRPSNLLPLALMSVVAAAAGVLPVLPGPHLATSQ